MTTPTTRLYNTLTRRIEPLVPIQPGKVSMYVCGPTVQDVAHAGHGRTYTTFDVLRRYLTVRGFAVTYVRNITDVDDKILAKSREAGEPPLEYSRRIAKIHAEDYAALGLAIPEHEPRVSEHIPDILEIIERLIERGHAYVAETPKGQDVYFAVRSFAPYGKLSHREINDLLSGARIEVGETKRDSLDFALWKASGKDGWGWPSPWGVGRPGWHVECSAMSMKLLGEHFDIHGGGMDLIFPHHENEIAQSEAAHTPPLANLWMHGGFLQVDSEKMSKSLGNFVTIRDVLVRNDRESLRYFYLGSHYRGPLNFDVEKRDDGRIVFPGVDEAERRIEYLYAARDAATLAAADAPAAIGKALPQQAAIVREAKTRVLDALDQDLNTSVALAVLNELAKAANEIAMAVQKLRKDKAQQDAARALAAAAVHAFADACAPLGLLHSASEDFWARTKAQRLRTRNIDSVILDQKVLERTRARQEKNFARADAIRDELVALGVELLDTPETTTWRLNVG